MKLNHDFLAQMRGATQLLQTSGPAAATLAIQRALRGAPAPAAGTGPTPRLAGKNWQGDSGKQPLGNVEIAEDKGKFVSASCTNHAGTRAYKVYIPSRYEGQPLPLIVMLHGCRQNPDDFAAGTGMNPIAEQDNCFVVYPGQIHAANGSNCWNWFRPGDQQRDRGEPSIIADITREVIRTYHIDSNRVYIAGLSAGGAMAAIMGATYPELYAAVGIHSGLPVGSAHDVPSAFAAMGNGVAARDPLKPMDKTPSRNQAVPAIVFHGDRDTTVHPRNGDRCTADVVAALTRQGNSNARVENGSAAQGRTYTRTILEDSNGKSIAEQWVIHGAGHAWSGGSRRGSYTDPRGPAASREMVRFFRMHTQR